MTLNREKVDIILARKGVTVSVLCENAGFSRNRFYTVMNSKKISPNQAMIKQKSREQELTNEQLAVRIRAGENVAENMLQLYDRAIRSVSRRTRRGRSRTSHRLTYRLEEIRSFRECVKHLS